MRAASASSADRAQAVRLCVACAGPLIQAVLCAPEATVGVAEWRRASLLLYEMCKLDALAVSAELWRKDETGVSLLLQSYAAPGTVLAAVVAKEPGEWTREVAVGRKVFKCRSQSGRA